MDVFDRKIREKKRDMLFPSLISITPLTVNYKYYTPDTHSRKVGIKLEKNQRYIVDFLQYIIEQIIYYSMNYSRWCMYIKFKYNKRDSVKTKNILRSYY